MASPLVSYSPSRINTTLDVYSPAFGIPTEEDIIRFAVVALANALRDAGWSVVEDIYATGCNYWTYGFPYWTDPDEPFILFGDVVEIEGKTIHLVTPYQLLHNPPVYPGVIVRLAGNTSAESGDIVAQAITDETSLDAWVDTDGLTMLYRAKVPGPLQNNISIIGNGAWADSGITKGGGSTATSQKAHGASDVQVAIIEDSTSHMVLTATLNGHTLAPYSMGWKRPYTLVANPYQFVLFLGNHAVDVTWSGDNKQYNSFYWACAPYIEPSLRSAITYCAFVLTNHDNPSIRGSMAIQGWNSVAIAINGDLRTTFSGIDCGLTFPLTRLRSDAGPLHTNADKPLIRRAMLALPQDLSVDSSETRIVGAPWDCLMVSDWYEWGTGFEIDGHRWVQLLSQGEPPGLGVTAGTLFLAID